jgi:hypothetical protein
MSSYVPRFLSAILANDRQNCRPLYLQRIELYGSENGLDGNNDIQCGGGREGTLAIPLFVLFLDGAHKNSRKSSLLQKQKFLPVCNLNLILKIKFRKKRHSIAPFPCLKKVVGVYVGEKTEECGA